MSLNDVELTALDAVAVISVAVSAAGGLVATGSGDYTARIWSYERI